MEKKMEHEMETGIIVGYIGVKLGLYWGTEKRKVLCNNWKICILYYIEPFIAPLLQTATGWSSTQKGVFTAMAPKIKGPKTGQEP